MDHNQSKLIFENWNSYLEKQNIEEKNEVELINEAQLLTEAFYDDWDGWDWTMLALTAVPLAGGAVKGFQAARGAYNALKWGNTFSKAATTVAKTQGLNRAAQASTRVKTLFQGTRQARDAAGGLRKLRAPGPGASGASRAAARRGSSVTSTMVTGGGTAGKRRMAERMAELAAKYPRLSNALGKTYNFLEKLGTAAFIGQTAYDMGEEEGARKTIEALEQSTQSGDEINELWKQLLTDDTDDTDGATSDEKVDGILDELETALDKETQNLNKEAKKTERKVIKAGGRRFRGAKLLQSQGYGPKDADPAMKWEEIYDAFYADLKKNKLTSKLGRFGQDYIFGPRHKQALAALKSKTSKKPAKSKDDNDMSSINVKPIGTQAAPVPDKKEKPVTTVKRYTYKSPGQAIEAASRGELEPAYADNPEVRQALEKYKQS